MKVEGPIYLGMYKHFSDCFSNDSARSSQRPTRRSTRLKRDDSDDDDDKINVSQYGRIRRSRRLD